MSRPGSPRFNARMSYVNVLGGEANIGEIWHCGVGLAANSWVGQYRGLVLVPQADTPSLAVDGSYFRGRSVLQCSRSGSGSGLALTLATAIGSTTGLGEIFFVGRERVEPAGSSYDNLFTIARQNADTSYGSVLATLYDQTNHGYIAQRYNQSPLVNTFGAQVAGGTAPHLIEAAMEATGMSVYVDGVYSTYYGYAQTAPPLGQINQFFVGLNGGYRSDASIALAGWIFNPLTADQRVQLRELVRTDFAV